MFVAEIKEELVNHIIPFWKNLMDQEHGGYYGYMGYDLSLDKKGVKGCILNSRILWFFSNAYLLLQDEELLQCAKHAYAFLRDVCVDSEYGGVFWSLSYDGQTEDTTKHTYNQAFAIYALASYYDASGDEEALTLAMELFQIVETKCRDAAGYLESFSACFEPEVNDKLSENNVIADRTMNTLLHVFEAYTELYRVTGNSHVGDEMRAMLDIMADKIYNGEKGRQEVFFDRDWNPIIDLYSYGHDIETSWLVDRGLEVLGDGQLTEKISRITRQLTENIYQRAYINHSLVNEAENGVVDTTRIWWVQAEAIVGFVNGYEKQPEHKEYLLAAEDIWEYIKRNLIDRREGSEWFNAVDQTGKPLQKPIVEPWKCPYHNGRMCLEVLRRLG